MVSDLWTNLFKKNNQKDNYLTVLKKNILFETLDKTELHFISKTVHERNYRTEETIFHQGNLGTGMYVIVKGSVDIFTKDKDLTSKTPVQDVHVAHLVNEDFFGELSLIEENSRRTATAIAAEDTLLIGFFRPDLIETLDKSPTIGGKIVFQLAKVLLRRLQATTDKIVHLKKDLKVLVELQK